MKKKTTNKTKLAAKGMKKKTEMFMRKANKKVGKTVKALKKEWRREQPQREEYKEELKSVAQKALKSGIKIGGDIVETIKKDINEINKSNRNKNK